MCSSRFPATTQGEKSNLRPALYVTWHNGIDKIPFFNPLVEKNNYSGFVLTPAPLFGEHCGISATNL